MSTPDAPRLRLTMRMEDTDPLCEVCNLPVRIGVENFRYCDAPGCGYSHITCPCEHWISHAPLHRPR